MPRPQPQAQAAQAPLAAMTPLVRSMALATPLALALVQLLALAPLLALAAARVAGPVDLDLAATLVLRGRGLQLLLPPAGLGPAGALAAGVRPSLAAAPAPAALAAGAGRAGPPLGIATAGKLRLVAAGQWPAPVRPNAPDSMLRRDWSSMF